MSDILITKSRFHATVEGQHPNAVEWICKNIESDKYPVVIQREHLEEFIKYLISEELEVEVVGT